MTIVSQLEKKMVLSFFSTKDPRKIQGQGTLHSCKSDPLSLLFF